MYERIPDLASPGSTNRDWQLSFVEGRTGTVTSVKYPDDVQVLPSWVADGSGVLVSGTRYDAASSHVLPRDGTVTAETSTVAVNGCRPLNISHCLAPDGSVRVGSDAGDPSRPTTVLTDPDSGARFEIDGRFAGWLEVVR